jgi:hypothetical protein
MEKTAGRMGGIPGGYDASSLPRHERGTEAGKSAKMYRQFLLGRVVRLDHVGYKEG